MNKYKARLRPLGELIEILDSKRIPLSSAVRQGRKGPYPYYGAQGIIDSVDDFIFDGEYILLAEDGENLNSRKLPLALKANGRFWVNNHAHILRGLPGVIDDRYLLMAINNSDIRPYVTGAAQPKLSQANMRLIEIPVPPMEIQLGISQTISSYDDLIEKCERRIKVLDEMARALYLNLTTSGTEMPFRQLAEFSKGKKPTHSYGSPEDGLAKLILMDVLRGGQATYVDPSGLLECDSSDTLMVMDGSSSSEVFSGYRGVVGSTLARIRPIPGSPIGSAFLFRMLKERQVELKGVNVGAAIPHANKDYILGMSVNIPDQSKLEEFERVVGPISALIESFRSQIQVLRETRNLLLPRLLSGQLPVGDAA